MSGVVRIVLGIVCLGIGGFVLMAFFESRGGSGRDGRFVIGLAALFILGGISFLWKGYQQFRLPSEQQLGKITQELTRLLNQGKTYRELVEQCKRRGLTTTTAEELVGVIQRHAP